MKLIGTWKCVAGTLGDKKSGADYLEKVTVDVTKDTITLKDGNATVVMEYRLDTKLTPVVVKFKIVKIDSPSPPPPQSTLKKGSRADGIIELKGDELTICYDPDGRAAPKAFEAV